MILIGDADCGVRAVRPRLVDRLAVRLCGRRLDADLSAGYCPDDDVRHALRARALISERTRDELASALERLAARRRRAGPQVVAAELDTLRTVIAGRGPVAVRGMAMVQLLVTDASSALYPIGAAVERADVRALLAETRHAVADVPVGPLPRP
jgi:hypothetical protein